MARPGFLFFFIAFLLVSSVAIAARPDPSMTSTLYPESQPASLEEEAACENSSDEDCLIRRTLVAHVDYIYTQDNGKH